MTRTIVLGLALIAAAFTARSYTQQAEAGEKLDRTKEIRYATSDGRYGWSTLDVRRTIRAAVGRWPVEGGVDKALSVARCESGSDLMDHSTDGYTGTFQQSTRYWSGRRAHYNPDAWDKPLPHAASNPRANVVVSIRMAHDSGWSAWSCA